MSIFVKKMYKLCQKEVPFPLKSSFRGSICKKVRYIFNYDRMDIGKSTQEVILSQAIFINIGSRQYYKHLYEHIKVSLPMVVP